MVGGLEVFCNGGLTSSNFSPPNENGDNYDDEEQTAEHDSDDGGDLQQHAGLEVDGV